MINGYPYLGKDEHDARSPTQSLGESVFLNLNTDNFFTSLPLAYNLLARNTSLVGTMNKNRRSLPPSVHQKAPLHDTKVMKSDKATLTIYQGKVKKNVCILSTMHQTVTLESDSQRKKPDTVHFYNLTKVGVDVLDQMIRKYSTRSATRRWPVAVFYKHVGPGWHQYMHSLSEPHKQKNLLDGTFFCSCARNCAVFTYKQTLTNSVLLESLESFALLRTSRGTRTKSVPWTFIH